MKIQTKTKLDYGQIVDCVFEKWNPGEINKGKVIGISLWQNQYMRPRAFMINYTIEPLECSGFEHDNEETIPECHINTEETPRITI